MYPQSNDQRDQRDQREQRDQRDHSGEFGTALKIATFNLRNCALPHYDKPRQIIFRWEDRDKYESADNPFAGSQESAKNESFDIF